MPASEEGPLAEDVPCGLVDAAGVGGLGVAEPIGDGLGRIMVAAQQLEVFWEVDGSGEERAADVLCFHGLGDSPKPVIIPSYHEFNSPLKMPITRLLAHLTGDVGLRGFG